MTFRRLPVVIALVFLSGCAQQLVGRWTILQDSNAGPAPSVQLQWMEFKDDKTFTATATSEGKVLPMAGKWSYDFMKLKLDSDSGKHREYNAVVWWGKTLEVKEKQDGKTVTQKFKKG